MIKKRKCFVYVHASNKNVLSHIYKTKNNCSFTTNVDWNVLYLSNEKGSRCVNSKLLV